MPNDNAETSVHYYDDRGGLNFQLKDRQILCRLADVLGIKRLYEQVERPKLAYEMFNAAAGVTTSYEISRTMGGMGGCKSAEEFLASTLKDPLENALLPVLREMLEQGVLPCYLRFAAMDLLMDMIMNTYDWSK